MSTASTRECLSKLSKIPQRALGQNFLVEASIVQKSISWASLTQNDTVVEVGPGLGALTEALLNKEVTVYAIEKDPRLFQFLREKFSENARLDLQFGDAVKHPLANLPKNVEKFKIVANLPYSIASIWLEHILALDILPHSMVLMVQKEAGERWIAQAGTKKFSPIAIFLQSSYDFISKIVVQKKSFYPQPKVDSWLMYFERKLCPLRFSENFRVFLRQLFTRRRQQLGRICRENQDLALYSCLAKFLSDNNLSPMKRAEELPLEVWQNFYIT